MIINNLLKVIPFFQLDTKSDKNGLPTGPDLVGVGLGGRSP